MWRFLGLQITPNTTVSPSERSISAEAVEHVEQPSVVQHAEQAHDLADPAADDGQRPPWTVGGVRALDLQEGERDRRRHDMMRPALTGAPFEVIESEIVFEFEVLLFDGPATPRQRDEVDERRGDGEVQQIVLPLVGRGALTEEPALGSPPRARPRAAAVASRPTSGAPSR